MSNENFFYKLHSAEILQKSSYRIKHVENKTSWPIFEPWGQRAIKIISKLFISKVICKVVICLSFSSTHLVIHI